MQQRRMHTKKLFVTQKRQTEAKGKEGRRSGPRSRWRKIKRQINTKKIKESPMLICIRQRAFYNNFAFSERISDGLTIAIVPR
jgi:hypothetical protein